MWAIVNDDNQVIGFTTCDKKENQLFLDKSVFDTFGGTKLLQSIKSHDFIVKKVSPYPSYDAKQLATEVFSMSGKSLIEMDMGWVSTAGPVLMIKRLEPKGRPLAGAS